MSMFQKCWCFFTSMVNIDGTPMLTEYLDVHGKPYGVMEIGEQQDTLSSCIDGQWWDSSCGIDAIRWE